MFAANADHIPTRCILVEQRQPWSVTTKSFPIAEGFESFLLGRQRLPRIAITFFDLVGDKIARSVPVAQNRSLFPQRPRRTLDTGAMPSTRRVFPVRKSTVSILGQ